MAPPYIRYKSRGASTVPGWAPRRYGADERIGFNVQKCHPPLSTYVVDKCPHGYYVDICIKKIRIFLG